MGQMPDIYFSELLPESDICKLISDYNLGLELIQFSISENLDRFEETLKETKSLLERAGNPKTTVHGPFLDLNPMSFDCRIRQVTMDRFKKARDGALEIGANKIVYHTGWNPSTCFLEGWAERMCDFWTDFFQDPCGIQICMENVFDPEIEPIQYIKDTMQHPDFSLCLDVGHAHCYSPHPVENWAASLKDGIGHLHLHDNHGNRDVHLALGNGTIPWERLFPVLFDKTVCNAEERPMPTCTLECNSLEDVVCSLKRLESYFRA